MGSDFLLQALVYMGAAILCVPLAKKLGMGSVLGYLIAGILIGPFVLGFIGSEGDDIMHFAEFGVVMLLFLIGLDLTPSRLWELRKTILGTGMSQFIVTMVLVSAIAYFIGMNWQSSLAIGMSMAMSSTAIVLQSLKETEQLNTIAGRNSFSVLLFQDIAVVPILAILPLLAFSPVEYTSGDEESILEWMPGWLQALSVLGIIAALFVIGRFVVPHFLKFVARTGIRELFTAAALLLVVGIAFLMTLVSLSPAMGTFVAGVILANSSFRHELETDLEPFKGLLLGLFFMAVGASINFNLFAENPMSILGLTIGIVILKAAILFTIGKVMKLPADQNLIMSLGLAQVGEFAFVTLTFTGQLRIISPDETGLLMAVIATTMVTTPVLIVINEKFILPRLNKSNREEIVADSINEKNKIIIAGFSGFGSTIGRFLRANGVDTTILDNDADRVELLRKMGFKVYFGDVTRYDLLHSAGAADAEILVSAIDDHATNLKLIETVRKHFPNLELMIRAKNRSDTYELMNLDVKEIYREGLDVSLRMGVEVMKKLGYRSYTLHRSALKFMKYDEQSMHELYKVRHDENKYISASRRQIALQEDILSNDTNQKPNLSDHAWDSDELKKNTE